MSKMSGAFTPTLIKDARAVKKIMQSIYTFEGEEEGE
jgi:hypothetical protein